MSRAKKTVEDDSAKVPAYIVTFSDMVTLLLTFFVLLLTLAKTRSPELFNKGRESFVESINVWGLGTLWGGLERPTFGKIMLKHYVLNPDENADERIIDSSENQMRRIIQQIAPSVDSFTSQITSKNTNFSATDIHFERDSWELNESAKVFLSDFSSDLQQSKFSQKISLYVVGLARDVSVEKRQWALSALRAQQVGNFLKSSFSEQSACEVYSWGSGPGGMWINQDSPVSEESHILIAVMDSSRDRI
ncbi:MAG: flagellar motor protein MotB [Planctomycetota bacterium]